MLTTDEAIAKRDEFLQRGCVVVPGVLHGAMLQEVRTFVDQTLEAFPVGHEARYQGSDIHVSSEHDWPQLKDLKHIRTFSPVVDKLLALPEQVQACRAMGFEQMSHQRSAIILSKPPGGPQLYWHQDGVAWNHPKAALPWPTSIFLSYYTVDTTRHNGCLRVIPGSHRKRHRLHDLLPDAHSPEIQAINDPNHPMFMDPPDAVDVEVKAGDLVIADARVLHAAWGNHSDQSRPLVLQWHDVFPYPMVPSWWQGDVPGEVTQADPDAEYATTRTPSAYLK